MARILVVEDDAGIRTALVGALRERGHAVQTSAAGLPALQLVVDEPPDLVVLDLGLPDVDGMQVLSMLRGISTVPVVVVTARDEDRSIVRALDAGADDYVAKPFGADQLDARIRAVLRRAAAPDGSGQRVTVADLEVDAASRRAYLHGDPLDLTRKEFDLLLLLAQHVGEVVHRRDILAEVWQQAYGGGDRTLDVHLSWLRRKLGESAAEPKYLHNVRGVGVMLADPTRA